MARRSENQSTAAKVSARIAGECLAVRMRMLGRVVTSLYDDALRPFGVTAGQINVLVTVNMLTGEEAGSPTQSTVGQMLAMEKSTLSRNVERLVRDGLLTSNAGDDARSRWLGVTAKGNRMIERILPAWEQAQARAQDVLGRDGEQALYQSADKLWKKAAGLG